MLLRLDLQGLQEAGRLPGRVVEHGMRWALRARDLGAHAEARLFQERALEVVLALPEDVRRDAVDREAHAAGDVDADGERNDRVLRREYAADGQAVADVGIGHQRANYRDRQSQRV